MSAENRMRRDGVEFRLGKMPDLQKAKARIAPSNSPTVIITIGTGSNRRRAILSIRSLTHSWAADGTVNTLLLQEQAQR
jgi:hypothetical protein